MNQKTFQARVKPWRRGWEIHIDGLGVTQARRLSEVEERTRDYIDSLTGHADAGVELSYDLGELSNNVTAAQQATRAAAEAQQDAAAQNRRAAADLRAAGLSVSEVAIIMGVSPSRVSQLLSPTSQR